MPPASHVAPKTKPVERVAISTFGKTGPVSNFDLNGIPVTFKLARSTIDLGNLETGLDFVFPLPSPETEPDITRTDQSCYWHGLGKSAIFLILILLQIQEPVISSEESFIGCSASRARGGSPTGVPRPQETTPP